MIDAEKALKENLSFANYLEREYELRRKINSAYSWRAFARYIEVDQSTLSKYLKGKRQLSWKTIETCMERLSTPHCLKDHFKKQRALFRGGYEDYKNSEAKGLEDWLCFAILEFFKIDALANAEKIAIRFSVSPKRAAKCLACLEELGFLQQENNSYKLLRPNNKWVHIERTTEDKRRLQQNYLELSSRALKRLPAQERYHGALTVAIDKDRLREAQEKLAAFQEEFGRYIQKEESLSEVYQLTLSFFPLTTSPS